MKKNIQRPLNQHMKLHTTASRTAQALTATGRRGEWTYGAGASMGRAPTCYCPSSLPDRGCWGPLIWALHWERGQGEPSQSDVTWSLPLVGCWTVTPQSYQHTLCAGHVCKCAQCVCEHTVVWVPTGYSVYSTCMCGVYTCMHTSLS